MKKLSARMTGEREAVRTPRPVPLLRGQYQVCSEETRLDLRTYARTCTRRYFNFQYVKPASGSGPSAPRRIHGVVRRTGSLFVFFFFLVGHSPGV